MRWYHRMRQRLCLKSPPWPIASTFFLCVGCSILTEPGGTADGEYLLSALGDSTLPVRYASIPSTDGSSTGCWVELTEGQLKLVAIDGAFRMSSVYRNSCTGEKLWEGNMRGSFSQVGSTLSFIVQDVGHTVSFAGVAWRDSVRVDFVDPVDNSRWVNHFVR